MLFPNFLSYHGCGADMLDRFSNGLFVVGLEGCCGFRCSIS
jgi:hypothetical protein